jgi:hypothetical protein
MFPEECFLPSHALLLPQLTCSLRASINALHIHTSDKIQTTLVHKLSDVGKRERVLADRLRWRHSGGRGWM